MSLEKLAQDAYTQGLTETLRNMNVSDQVKIASYKIAQEGDSSISVDPVTAGALALGVGGAGLLAKKRYDMAKKKEDADILQGRLTSGIVGAGIGGMIPKLDSMSRRPIFSSRGLKPGITGALLGAGTMVGANELLRDLYFDKDERVMQKFLGMEDKPMEMRAY